MSVDEKTSNNEETIKKLFKDINFPIDNETTITGFIIKNKNGTEYIVKDGRKIKLGSKLR